MFITDPKVKELEIINIQRLKKEASNPPGEIDKWTWTKNYMFNNYFGQHVDVYGQDEDQDDYEEIYNS